MAKKITMSDLSLIQFSRWNLARKHLGTLEVSKKAEKDEINNRKALTDKTKIGWEAPFDRELAAVDVKYNGLMKPLKATMSEVENALDRDLYYAFLVAGEKGSASAKGIIDYTTPKGTKVSYEVTRSFSAQLHDFLKGLDCDGLTDVQLQKLYIYVKDGVGGRVATKNTDDHFVKDRTCKQFRTAVIRNILEYCVYKLNVWSVLSDGTIVERSSLYNYYEDDVCLNPRKIA